MQGFFSSVEYMMDALCEPLGECAPKRRRLTVDYKDSNAKDFHQDLVAWCNQEVTDTALVESVRADLAGSGYKLTAIVERLDDGKNRVLYLAPGYLEETVEEMGLQAPDDVPAALEAHGIHPINWKELEKHR